MIQTTRKNLLLFFGAIVVFVFLYFFVYWPISPLGRQLYNQRMARDQADILREKFKHDERFRGVIFIGTFKREDLSPCLLVSGSVLAPEDCFAITNAVESLKCPLEIIYQLESSNRLFSWADREGKKPFFLRR
jgi:hypothetical protein